MQGKNCIFQVTLALFWIVLTNSIGLAELKINSVSPGIGEMGKDLEVTLTGTGFDENTRVSMYTDAGNRNAIIGSVGTSGPARRVTVADGMAFVVCHDYEEWQGLEIIDVGDPGNPGIVSSLEIPAEDVAVSGKNAFVAAGDSGFQVVDISDPADPRIISSVIFQGSVQEVVVSGETAFVTTYRAGGFHIIDISDPASPRIIGSIENHSYRANLLTVSDGKAFVTDEHIQNLQIIDISNPADPEIISSFDNSAFRPSDITVSEGKAFVADMHGDILVVDISDPTDLEIIDRLISLGSATNVAVSDGKVFVSNRHGGIQVIDVSDLLCRERDQRSDGTVIPMSELINPRIGWFDTPGAAYDFVVSEGKAFVADGHGGLQIIDIRNPSWPRIGSFYMPEAFSLAISGEMAVVGWGGNILVTDISNPADPQYVASPRIQGRAYDIALSEGKAFVASGKSGLQIIDITDPSARIIGSLGPLMPLVLPSASHCSAEAVTISEGKVFITDSAYGNTGFYMIDISIPDNPRIMDSEVLSASNWGSSETAVFVSEGKAFVADLHDFYIFDISDLQLISSLCIFHGEAKIAVSGKNAFVADDVGLHVLDISEPAVPRVIGSVDIPGFARSVVVSEKKAFVGCSSGWSRGKRSGVQVIDISDPEAPVIIGEVATPGSAEDITVSGEKAFVADGNAGLIIMPLPVEIENLTVNSETEISLTLPSPRIAGPHTLRVFNGAYEYDELVGRVTYAEPAPHSADYSPADRKIALSELLRVIQFYNQGACHCDSGSEDGYAPGTGDQNCAAHDSDYSPRDWRISLSELLRMIQLYNSPDGYHADESTEDGFAPGN
ncbi:hypothetical protein QUF72_04610 [Desulfobacterales bacterium HSG2]|nr:hypothetical protein [Desulfobacterales bacterium HSG2]